MKFAVVLAFAALFAVAVAAPSGDAQTLRSDAEVFPDGFKYAYETSNGISANEQGDLKNAGTEHEAIVVHGSYSWTDEKTGEKFTLNYVADENGFQPQGAHLPVAPEA